LRAVWARPGFISDQSFLHDFLFIDKKHFISDNSRLFRNKKELKRIIIFYFPIIQNKKTIIHQ